MFIAAVIILVIISSIYVFMRRPQFGRMPSGKELERLKTSPQYRESKFQNQHLTPDLTNGANYYSILRDFIFKGSKQSKPPRPLPSIKTNLLQLDPAEDVFVWFGHSSYFLQIDGRSFLVDPVLSGNASPLSFTTKSFPGSDIYTAEDFPAIDHLLVSHDHWDHLDYDTLMKLKPKIRSIVTGLGTALHLQRWGFDPAIIHEKDWYETVDLKSGFVIHTTPARHFSGRTFKRQQSLWLSFVLQTPSMKLFLGGDSGYDTHFSDIGNLYGPFDLAILECGQYNTSWQNIHMMPEEVVQAAEDLQAKTFIPVHWSKFSLALHSWDEPIKRVVAAAQQKNVPLLHPMIGQKLLLKKDNEFEQWWLDV